MIIVRLLADDLGDGLGDLDATAVRYDEKGKARITLGGEQGTTISNVRAGVASSTLAAAGYRETQPKVPNDSAANMARNRRIELWLTD